MPRPRRNVLATGPVGDPGAYPGGRRFMVALTLGCSIQIAVKLERPDRTCGALQSALVGKRPLSGRLQRSLGGPGLHAAESDGVVGRIDLDADEAAVQVTRGHQRRA